MKSSSKKPTMIIVAGPNGAGKTTFTNSRLKHLPIVNPDTIAAEIDKLRIDDASIQRQAAVKALMLREELLSQEKSFVIETTLSGKGEKKLIEQAKSHGYKIIMYYVGVDSPRISIKRIESRVREGGHNVPCHDVERRYFRSIENLASLLPMIDKTTIIDNSGKLHKVVVSLVRGRIEKKNLPYPQWLNAALIEEKQVKIKKNNI